VQGHELEIAELEWVGIERVDQMMEEARDDLTPWFREEWALLRGPHAARLESFLAASGGGSDMPHCA
jgi:isopentenyldiphosphate isomerase